MLRVRFSLILSTFALFGVAVACDDSPTTPGDVSGSVAGMVTEDGEPVEGIDVHVSRAGEGWLLGEATTDADGSFEITYSVREDAGVGDVILSVEAEGYGSYSETLPFEEGVEHDVAVVWEGFEDTAEGTVTSEETGEGVEGASLVGYEVVEEERAGQLFEATTDEEGFFEVTFRSPEEPETVEVAVEDEDYVPVAEVQGLDDGLSFDLLVADQLFGGGVGTEEWPFEIETVEHLQAIDEALDAHFVQVADIEVSDANDNGSEASDVNGEEGFEPIGHFEAPDHEDNEPFTGHYDGAGYAIEGLTIIRPEEDQVGLFAAVEDGEVSNLTLEAVDVSGAQDVGALAAVGSGDASFSDISVSGEVSAESLAGGTIGVLRDAASAVRVSSSAQVSAEGPYAGGVASLVGSDASIDDATVSGEVTAETDAGGIAGTISGEISRVNSLADVKAEVQRAGGIVGLVYPSGTVEQAHSAAEVDGGEEVGGLAGRIGGTVSYSSAAAVVTGDEEVGGFVGRLLGHVEESYSLSEVGDEDSERVGGFAGYLGGSVDVAYAAASVEGDSEYGAFAGHYSDAELSDVYFDQEVGEAEDFAGSGDASGYTALTTEEMQGGAAEASMDGLLFGVLWNAAEDAYPTLWWQ